MSSALITSKKRVEAASSATVAVHQLACKRHAAQKLVNVLKGSFPKGLRESDFMGSEEEVGERNAEFLNNEKERKAFMAAFPGMSQGAVDTAINKCRAVRKYVLRKGRNMKNGALTAAWVKGLLGACKG